MAKYIVRRMQSLGGEELGDELNCRKLRTFNFSDEAEAWHFYNQKTEALSFKALDGEYYTEPEEVPDDYGTESYRRRQI